MIRWKQRERALSRLYRKLQKAGAIHRRGELKALYTINAISKRIQRMRYEEKENRSNQAI
jgi:hypothetical protein